MGEQMNWATIQQPPPRNHGTPAIDALRPGEPFRKVVGDFLSDAAIERAEKIGLKNYGSLLTANNGRDQPIEILQEAADIPGALVAWVWEVDGDDFAAVEERSLLSLAMNELYEMTVIIRAAAMLRAKRLAKAKGEGNG